MVRTLVVARYAAVRAGLRSLLDDAVGVLVVGEAAGTLDLGPLAALQPEALVVDLDAADAVAVLDIAVARGLAVVALGDPDQALELLANRDLPGWASLTRGAGGSELAAAVRAASAGLVVMEPGVVSLAASTSTATRADDSLSAREREVLQLVAEGLPNKQIALRLGISPHTAKFHVAGVLQKLGAASRTEAVGAGLRRGLVTL